MIETKFQRMMRNAREFESDWRKGNQKCFDYYDGVQWTNEEESIIEERGQQATVINTILPTVDMVKALEVDKRIEIQVVGREDSDCAMADMLTAMLKHVFDFCDYDYYQSKAFHESLVGGIGWLEVKMGEDARHRDVVSIEHIHWEEMYIDPCSRKPDGSDARFMIRAKWLDRDVAKSLFGEKADLIDNHFEDDYEGQEYEAQMNSSGRDEFYFDKKNQRVLICECYYTLPEKEEIEVLNERTGTKEIKEVLVNKLHYVIFSDDIMLQGSAENDSENIDPTGINLYPFVPVICSKDHKGHPKGIVRNLIDIQDQINKLNSKFLWTISSNRLVAEEDAVKDLDEARDQYQRPDGLVVLNPGGLSKVRLDDKYRDLSYLSGHLNFLLMTEQRISGVNDSMLGLGGTNERSGIMQATRINQGASMQTSLMENLYFSKKRAAYLALRMIGKYYTDYRVLRVTRPNGMTDTYEFNVVQRDEQGNPITIFNNIEDTLDYDVVLKKVPPFNTMRERMLSIFSEVLKSGVIPPPVAAKLLLQLSDIPNKEDTIMEVENFYQKQMQAQAQMPPV